MINISLLDYKINVSYCFLYLIESSFYWSFSDSQGHDKTLVLANIFSLFQVLYFIHYQNSVRHVLEKIKDKRKIHVTNVIFNASFRYKMDRFNYKK